MSDILGQLNARIQEGRAQVPGAPPSVSAPPNSSSTPVGGSLILQHLNDLAGEAVDPSRVHGAGDLPPNLAGADLSGGAPYTMRFALGLPSDESGQLNYLKKAKENGDIADFYNDPKGGLFIKRTKEDRWAKVDPVGPDVGDIFGGGPEALQAGASIVAGAVTADPFIAGGVAGASEQLRQRASEAVGAHENLTDPQRQQRVDDSFLAGGISQAASNVGARAIQQLTPRNVAARQIASDARNLGKPFESAPDRMVLEGTDQVVRSAEPSPGIAQQIGSAAKFVARQPVRAAKAVGRGLAATAKAATGVPGRPGAITEGAPLAESLGAEGAKRWNLFNDYGVKSATVAARTGSSFAMGLEDLAVESGGASAAPVVRAREQSLSELRDAITKTVGGTGSAAEQAKAGVGLQVRYSKLVTSYEDQIAELSKKDFGDAHRMLRGKKVFSYDNVIDVLDNEIKKLSPSVTTADFSAKASLEKIRDQLVSSADTSKSIDVTSRQFSESLSSWGRAVRQTEDVFGETRHREAHRITSRIYGAAMDDLDAAREKAAASGMQDGADALIAARERFKTRITALEKVKTGLLSQVVGAAEDMAPAGETTVAKIAALEPSHIERVMKAITRMDPGTAQETRTAVIGELLGTAKDFKSYDEALYSVAKLSTTLGKQREKLAALFVNNPAGMKSIDDIAKLASYLEHPAANSRTFQRLDWNNALGMVADLATGSWQDAAQKGVQFWNKRRMAYMLASPDMAQTFLRLTKFPKGSAAAIKTAGVIAKQLHDNVPNGNPDTAGQSEAP